MSAATALVLIAKDPGSRRVKTRLAASIGAVAAVAVARAMLADTVAAMAASGARRRVVVLDGDDASWVPSGFEVIPQRGAGLGERLAAAFEDIGCPAFLVGSDTPQLTPDLLDAARSAVEPGTAAVGPAADGGYWGIGLAEPDRRCFVGVPMSQRHTLAVTRRRIRAVRLSEVVLTTLSDVDDIRSLRAVAGGCHRANETVRCFSALFGEAAHA